MFIEKNTLIFMKNAGKRNDNGRVGLLKVLI